MVLVYLCVTLILALCCIADSIPNHWSAWTACNNTCFSPLIQLRSRNASNSSVEIEAKCQNFTNLCVLPEDEYNTLMTNCTTYSTRQNCSSAVYPCDESCEDDSTTSVAPVMVTNQTAGITTDDSTVLIETNVTNSASNITDSSTGTAYVPLHEQGMVFVIVFVCIVFTAFLVVITVYLLKQFACCCFKAHTRPGSPTSHPFRQSMRPTGWLHNSVPSSEGSMHQSRHSEGNTVITVNASMTSIAFNGINAKHTPEKRLEIKDKDAVVNTRKTQTDFGNTRANGKEILSAHVRVLDDSAKLERATPIPKLPAKQRDERTDSGGLNLSAEAARGKRELTGQRSHENTATENAQQPTTSGRNATESGYEEINELNASRHPPAPVHKALQRAPPANAMMTSRTRHNAASLAGSQNSGGAGVQSDDDDDIVFLERNTNAPDMPPVNLLYSTVRDALPTAQEERNKPAATSSNYHEVVSRTSSNYSVISDPDAKSPRGARGQGYDSLLLGKTFINPFSPTHKPQKRESVEIFRREVAPAIPAKRRENPDSRSWSQSDWQTDDVAYRLKPRAQIAAKRLSRTLDRPSVSRRVEARRSPLKSHANQGSSGGGGDYDIPRPRSLEDLLGEREYKPHIPVTQTRSWASGATLALPPRHYPSFDKNDESDYEDL